MTLRSLRLNVSDAAQQSADEQAEYYRVESGTVLALRWRTAVNNAIRSLRTMPERGAPCRFATRTVRDVRWIPIEGFRKHMIFYRLDTALSTVFILKIVHGMRNIESELY